jgi:23S rRNA (adenine2503-C2)-methyltransferase
MADKTDLKELTREQLAAWLEQKGLRPFRAAQILKWVYIRQADSFSEMTDLRKDVRELLSREFSIDRLKREGLEVSNDGSRKFLFALKDGRTIETVLIPEREHYTLCVSTQVGCAQGCRFCLTATGGFERNLTRGEIIAQVRDCLQQAPADRPLRNLVFMGMGEPLANYRNLVEALSVITDHDCGLKFAHRRVTVSTAGLVPRMADLGRDTKVNLAVSLNATDDETRSRLMPINRTYPLAALLTACRHYPLPSGRKITFEYILLKGVNDSLADARRLAKLLAPIRSKINLIPFNAHAGSPLATTDEAQLLAFQEILLKRHYTVVIRRSKGQDISAACGQLRSRHAAGALASAAAGGRPLAGGAGGKNGVCCPNTR